MPLRASSISFAVSLLFGAREERDLMEAQVVLGFPGIAYGDDDYITAQIASSILGGGMSSRLFQEIREKRGLCYSIYAFHWGFEDAGIFGISAATGERLDSTETRGVRVSRMDLDAQSDALPWLRQQGLDGEHPREAMVLAAKVAAAPGMVAELCWSDDPEYTTGYVASPRHGYVRIPCLKEKNSSNGGRAFFVSPDADLEALQHFLEEQPVLVQNRPQKGQAS